MSEASKRRVPIKEGYFTVPEDPEEAPRLLGTRCGACGEHFFPRRAICARCLSERTEDAELSPEGTLYSFTFVHFPLFGSMNMEHFSGYGVGQVDLPEGPRVQAPLAGAQADFRVGQKVRLELDKLREDDMDREVLIVRFRPSEGRP
jgi:uncharacterized OB-fold protein